MRGTLRFGVFEADIRAGELRKQGTKIKLQDQPFQVLLALLEKPGEVISREELQKRIWPADTFIDFDHGVNNAIRRLREALGDSAENPRFIETLSRRRYRFIAPVTASEGGAGVAEVPNVTHVEARRRRMPWWAIAACVVVLVVAALLAARVFRLRDRILADSPPQIRSLAVLPFTNLSGDPAQEYFSDGMTDALITDLAQISSVKVISRTSTIRYKKTDKPLPDIARELNVDGIIEGTVQRSGDRVRITAQLIHAPADKHLWASSYERDVRDVFLLERDVTEDIANQVRVHIPMRDHPPAEPRTLDQNVLDAYLQGNYHLNSIDGIDGVNRDRELRTAGQFFQQVIDAAPDFAPAYIGLAKAHQTRWWPSSEDSAIMQASAAKALELAPTSSEAHQAMSETKSEGWDWAAAEEESKRAVEFSPNNAAAHDQHGETLAVMGRMDEAWKEYELAQQLDPNQDHLSHALYFRGEYDRSIELLQRMHPDDGLTHLRLFLAYAQQGKHAESVRELEKCATLFGFPEVATRLDRAFATSGWTGALRQWAKELEQAMATKQSYFPGCVGQVYAELGEKDKAFYWLEDGARHRHLAGSDPCIQLVKVDPWFAPLHSDPRFKVLLQHMGLPE
jgi:TolB-like protein/DNA-binding winged helix-turn-helix (wHTH) protein